MSICKHCGGEIVADGSWNGAYFKHADHTRTYDHAPEPTNGRVADSADRNGS